MRGRFDEMHEDIAWEVATEANPEYPGLETFAAAVTIPGRKDLQIIRLTEDVASDVTFTLPKQYEPSVGDRLDGATVLKVGTVSDTRGKVLRWVAYARA